MESSLKLLELACFFDLFEYTYLPTISSVMQVYTDPDRCAWDIRREGDKLSYRLRSLTRPSQA